MSEKGIKVSEKLSCYLKVGSANFGFFRCVRFRSFTMSAVRILKKPCAIEQNKLMFGLGLYLIEIILYSSTMSVRVACTKRKNINSSLS